MNNNLIYVIILLLIIEKGEVAQIIKATMNIMPITTIKNEEIYYAVSGNTNSPFTLLFLHGACSTYTSLTSFAPSMSEYNCIYVDLPCHGKSKGSIRRSVEAYADFTEDFILSLQDEKIISSHLTLIGCSMGGFISLELAIRKFAPVNRIIVISSGADSGNYSEIIPYIEESTPETFDPRPLLKKSFGPHFNEDFVSNIIKSMESSGFPSNEICYYDFATVKYFNKLDKVKNLTIPTLAIIGDCDKIIPPICSFHLLENMANCNLAIIPFAGHTVFLDAEVYVPSIMLEFLSSN